MTKQGPSTAAYTPFQMGGLECVITGLMDEFKDYFIRWNITREIFTGIIVVVSFIVALCCVTPVSYE